MHLPGGMLEPHSLPPGGFVGADVGTEVGAEVGTGVGTGVGTEVGTEVGAWVEVAPTVGVEATPVDDGPEVGVFEGTVGVGVGGDSPVWRVRVGVGVATGTSAPSVTGDVSVGGGVGDSKTIPIAASVSTTALFTCSGAISVPWRGALAVIRARIVASIPVEVTTKTWGAPCAETPSKPGSNADIPHALSGQAIRARTIAPTAAARRRYQGTGFVGGMCWYFS
jgi:hypothetical protein